MKFVFLKAPCIETRNDLFMTHFLMQYIMFLQAYNDNLLFLHCKLGVVQLWYVYLLKHRLLSTGFYLNI